MPWTLENAEDLAAAAPRSFFIPPPEIRHHLRPGDAVKLIFRLEREDGEVATEPMWVHEPPAHTWELDYLTDRWPEAAQALREGFPPRGLLRRRERGVTGVRREGRYERA